MMSRWKCFICGIGKKYLRLVPCIRIPRHIVSFDVSDYHFHILTTVCFDCLKNETEEKEYKKRIKKIKPTEQRPDFIPTVQNIPLPSTGKKYCLGCLFLPNDCLCKVKKEREIVEVHITDKACEEYVGKVF